MSTLERLSSTTLRVPDEALREPVAQVPEKRSGK